MPYQRRIEVSVSTVLGGIVGFQDELRKWLVPSRNMVLDPYLNEQRHTCTGADVAGQELLVQAPDLFQQYAVGCLVIGIPLVPQRFHQMLLPREVGTHKVDQIGEQPRHFVFRLAARDCILQDGGMRDQRLVLLIDLLHTHFQCWAPARRCGGGANLKAAPFRFSVSHGTPPLAGFSLPQGTGHSITVGFSVDTSRNLTEFSPGSDDAYALHGPGIALRTALKHYVRATRAKGPLDGYPPSLKYAGVANPP